MAGDWIKMECSTPDKQEVLTITARMGWDDPDLAVGKLFRVWRWFDQHTIDGNAPSVTLALLDRIAGAPGFGEAMSVAGWLAVSGDGVSLPNFHRHCGKTAKDRALTAKRVAEHKSNATSNGVGNAATVTPALPREDKREEKKEKKQRAPVVPKGDAAEAVIDAYHEMLPKCRRCEVLTPKLRKKIEKISALAVFSMKRHGLEYDPAEFWSAYFGECQSDPWKSGEKRNPNNPSWRQHIGCLIDDERFQDIMDNAIGRMREAGELP